MTTGPETWAKQIFRQVDGPRDLTVPYGTGTNLIGL